MRKIASGCFFVIAFWLFFPNFCFAEKVWPVGRWGIGPRISLYYMNDYDLTADTEINTSASALFEGNVTWYARKWFSLELSGGYVRTNADVPYQGQRPDIGEFQQIPILLTARFHLWHPDNWFNLYGGGGVGYYFNDFDVSGDLSGIIPPPGYSLSLDNSFGAHVAAGFEGFITNNWCINADVKYIWNEAEYSESVPGFFSPRESINLDALVFGIGFKYYF